MTLAEILDRYIKIKNNDDGFIIYAANPEWISPHETETRWEVAYEKQYDHECLEVIVPGDPTISSHVSTFGKYGITDPEICKGLQKVLDRKKFFKTCDECGIRTPSFQMSGRICQSCTPIESEIVY